MVDVEKREAARQFYNKWVGRGREDEDDRSYWIDILTRIMGVKNATDHIEFQKKVIVDGNIKRLDAYIPETKVIIEQKTLGISLDKKCHQSGGIELTPYEQAKRYNDNLPYDEKARWIVTSNFAEIWIYDMNMRVPDAIKIEISNLQSQYSILDFLINQNTETVNLEMEISLQAGILVGKMYDAFLHQYKNAESPDTLKNLNKLCVRIVFCLYGEDAGIFGKHCIFHDYLIRFNKNTARKGLRDLFKVLNQKPEERDAYLADDDPLLAAFPYVNGGLFADEDIEIPPFTDEIFQMILQNASDNFDWSKISPTIFGAVFESTLNPETRRSGGMHYTSIENIHKVIDPLFFDDLKKEFAEIEKKPTAGGSRTKAMREFQLKLSNLTFLDPACGSGNFLTETFLSIRKLENSVLKYLTDDIIEGQMRLSILNDEHLGIKVSIAQFYGIEINDFAVTVAKTALWIAEAQMIIKTEDIVGEEIPFLPLKTNAYIAEGNALELVWEDIINPAKLNYIYGNPPFIGSSLMTAIQKNDTVNVLGKIKLSNSIDYVGAWYVKSAKYIQKNKDILASFVSTNSITQGEQVYPLWNVLLNKYKLEIIFAYRTFIWNSESFEKAKVHCVIIGLKSSSSIKKHEKIIFEGNRRIKASNINPYLIDAPDVLIDSYPKPICDVPICGLGNTAKDEGYLILTTEEKDAFVKKYPDSEKLIRRYIGGRDFIRGDEERYCFWLKGVGPNEYNNIPELMNRIKLVKEFREKSTSKDTRKTAETPYLFFRTPHIESDYLIIPRTTSHRRRYIPLGFASGKNIGSDAVMLVYDASLYHLGILISNVHAAWMRTVGGRLKSDYRYSGVVVYNTFPWPTPTVEQKTKIEQTAQGILDARALYSASSLADLYDPLTMPPELIKAHAANDKAVMQAYGYSIKDTSEANCVAALMKMYQKLTEK